MSSIQIRHIRHTDYLPIWRAMQRYTEQRDASTADEFWIVAHDPVYTLGLNGKTEHILTPTSITVQGNLSFTCYWT